MKILGVVLLLAGIVISLGCSGSPVAPEKDMEAFFAGVSPTMTGVIGDYTFTGKDGTIETGKLVADETGIITVPDRAGACYCSTWFDCSIDYYDYRYFSDAGLPVYYLGDTMRYCVNLDYKKCLPLNWYPLLYACASTEQRYWPSLAPLPGAFREEWCPLEIEPCGEVQLCDTYYIPPGAIPGNDCTVVSVELEFLCGWFEFNIHKSVCGLWDP